ncbi:hypothetical protein O3P69_011566 [Scylla paramamosain]|uniref:Uncharacterized protein n=1 Tax=Scylla paramamosain TaxID=85552 RepID=A0AAW0T6Y3_SCYPA
MHGQFDGAITSAVPGLQMPDVNKKHSWYRVEYEGEVFLTATTRREKKRLLHSGEPSGVSATSHAPETSVEQSVMTRQILQGRDTLGPSMLHRLSQQPKISPAFLPACYQASGPNGGCEIMIICAGIVPQRT